MDMCENLVNPDWAKHGYIQVYTGDGKGKRTSEQRKMCALYR